MGSFHLPFLGRRQATGFDYLALIGFAINMAVVAVIVVHWLTPESVGS